MKHIKLYEDFLNESKVNEKKVDPAEIETAVAEIVKKTYEQGQITGYSSNIDDPEQVKLKYEMKLLKHKGDEAGAEKVKKAMENRNTAQRNKIDQLEKEKKNLVKDFEKKYSGIAAAGTFMYAATHVALWQARMEGEENRAKAHKSFIAKAGKEISEREKAYYEGEAKEHEDEAKSTRKELEEKKVSYKKALEVLKSEDGKEGGKKGKVVAKKKFPTDETEAGEDVFEWLMDTLKGKEDVKISDEEQEQARESSPEEVASFVNGLLKDHKVDTKETGRQIEIIVTEK